MIQGGIAQGVGAALLEEYVHDEDGQLLTTTFMDYLIPTVHDVPIPEKAALVTPSPFTPLGAKGVGEGGAIPGPAAVANAVEDALAHLGVVVRSLPITPEQIWRWLA
jgi:carbon-monoxide dehydrogenase large subunit